MLQKTSKNVEYKENFVFKNMQLKYKDGTV